MLILNMKIVKTAITSSSSLLLLLSSTSCKNVNIEYEIGKPCYVGLEQRGSRSRGAAEATALIMGMEWRG